MAEEKTTERKITKCTACGANIFFVKTRTGKYNPVDAEIVTSDGKQLLWVDELTGFKKLEAGRKGYISHFSTCPDADRFRRKDGNR